MKSEHYFKRYADLETFISYFYQVDNIINKNPDKVLEIGVGNKIVSNYLKSSGYDITTCDIEESLNPDIIGDITKLPFNDNSFDFVYACEVLEHIPFEMSCQALGELHRVTKKYCMVSIPYPTIHTEINVKLNVPYLRKKSKFLLQFPLSIHKHKKGVHHWEMGRKGTPKRMVKREIAKLFDIEKEFQPELNPYHYFFILRKK